MPLKSGPFLHLYTDTYSKILLSSGAGVESEIVWGEQENVCPRSILNTINIKGGSAPTTNLGFKNEHMMKMCRRLLTMNTLGLL